MRFRRALTVLVLAVLALGTLTACRTKIGQAASVNGVSFSDSDLGSYLRPGAGPYTASNQRVVPKVLILTTWIRTQLIDAAIAPARRSRHPERTQRGERSRPNRRQRRPGREGVREIRLHQQVR